jgi:hypothetical protein
MSFRLFDTPEETSGYGFECRGCGAGLLLVPGHPPRPPFVTQATQLDCTACRQSHDYVGRMVRVMTEPDSADDAEISWTAQ